MRNLYGTPNEELNKRGHDGVADSGNAAGRRRLYRLIAVSALFVGSAAAVYHRLRQPIADVRGANRTHSVWTGKHQVDRTNILLIGTDKRPDDPSGHTDVLVLCSIDDKHKRIEFMSIPRDTKVQYPNGHTAKINESLNIGGPVLAVQLVSKLLNQPIDHYAITHFDGLVDIINTIGGIELNVDENMDYNTGDKQYNRIHLHKGKQLLNGSDALGYVRFRHDALGDIGRTKRQQQFLAATAEQLLQPANIVRLPTLVHQFWGTIDSDLSVMDVVAIATHAEAIRTYQAIHETLPGSFHDPDPAILDDASYWIVNPLQAQYAAEQFFEKGLVQTNPVQDPVTTEHWQRPTSSAAKTTKNPSASRESPVS